MSRIALLLAWIASTGITTADLEEFTTQSVEDNGWTVVNDGVMGGLSKGKIETSDDGILTFKGNLSLENNGGFSSIRSNRMEMDLSGAKGVKLRVLGDGRTYQMRFNTDAKFRGREISFKADFPTQKDEWSEVFIPFSEFTGSFRGMDIPKAKFDPSKIQRLGLLLADKKAGGFELQIDWIRAADE